MTELLYSIRRILRRAGAVTLCAALLLTGAPTARAADAITADTMITVSLTYQSGAVTAAALTANGFLLGSYDARDAFVQTGETQRTTLALTAYDNGTIGVQVDGLDYATVSTGQLVVRAADGGTIGYGGNDYACDLVVRLENGKLSVLNRLSLDDYVAGVLPYEMVATWPLETLKAGAVAARTYAASSTKHQSSGFDVCTTTCCQVYNGVYTSQGAENVLLAASQTAGICAYYNGQLIEALYHASSGGLTEDSENVWSSALPYLRGKVDPYDASSSNPYTSWSYSFTAEELTALIRAGGENCATIVSVEVTGRTAVGNVAEVTFTDATGKTYVFSKDAVRTVFRRSGKVTTFSRTFTISAPNTTQTTQGGTASVITGSGVTTRAVGAVVTANGTSLVAGTVSAITSRGTTTVDLGGTGGTTTNSTDAWVVSGAGYGHNVGMSQWGAYNMGLQGYTYEDILKFYYTGITLE
jgi:stage II sporulation protein D